MIEKFFAADDATASIDNTHPGTKLGVAFLHSQADGGAPNENTGSGFRKISSRSVHRRTARRFLFRFLFSSLSPLSRKSAWKSARGGGCFILLATRYTLYGIYTYISLVANNCGGPCFVDSLAACHLPVGLSVDLVYDAEISARTRLR